MGDRAGIENALAELSKTINQMDTQVEGGLKELDQRTQQMVELVSKLPEKQNQTRI